MSRLYRYLISLCLLLLAHAVVQAQQFPVTASTQIIPPYSVYLADYAVPGSDKLRVILLQQDLTTPSYDVSLQMTVEINGTVIMRTAGYFHPRPLNLSPGVPTIISGADLSDYLQPDNIEFSGGYSRAEYERTKSLPEGAYRISFTAFDYRRPTVQVSNAGSNVFYFKKSDPPLLNLPVCGSRVEKREPQFLSFNWSSRNTTNGSTTYVFSLYEVKPAGSTPDYIVRSAVPIYTLTTDNNTLIYGPGEPLLVDSMQYVWRVQARDKNGKDLFANEGYSTSCTFTYLGTNPFEQLGIPKPALNGTASGERGINYHWAPGTKYDVVSYRLQYRPASKDNVVYDWQTQESATDTVYELRSLEPGRTYEARLQWQIGGVYGPYSDILNITTAAAKTFVCGDGNAPPISTNTKPQQSLIAGDVVRAGYFDVLLTNVTGTAGVFTGRGKIITGGLGTGMLLEFKDVSINTDLVVTKGELRAVTKGIAQFITDEIKTQRGGDDVGQVKTGNVVTDVKTSIQVLTPAQITVDTASGKITIHKADHSKSEVIDLASQGKSLPVVIEDVDGKLYSVDQQGHVSYAGQRSETPVNTQLDISGGKVTFAAAATNKYAFDQWKAAYAGKTVLENSYESLAGGQYRVSAKAIVPSATEQVIATLEGSADTTGIRFVSGKGIVYPAERNGHVYTVTITGGPAGDAQDVYAVRNNISIGKLLVASYEPRVKKLVLVPVGYRATVPEVAIRKSLADAYAGLGVTYTVEVDESFRYNKTWDKNGDSLLQDSRSAFLSNAFTGEEKALKKAYVKSVGSIDNDAVYLFVVNEAALGDGDLLGKMPRQSQFGFIFSGGATGENIARSVAHEIGHGDYTLEHTFSAGIGLTKGETDNLMDYKDGYRLVKYQWDVVHDPGNVWGIFEDDTESDLIRNSYMLISDYLLPGTSKADYEDNGYVNYIDPGGSIVRLKNDIKVTFEGYQESLNGKYVSSNSSDAKGFLMGFVKDGVNWVATFSGGMFVGYINSADHSVNYDYTSTKDAVKAVAGVEIGSCQLGIFAGTYTPRELRYFVFTRMVFDREDYNLLGIYKATGANCVTCGVPFERKPWALQKVLAVLYTLKEESEAVQVMIRDVNEETMKNFICVEDRFLLIKTLAKFPVVSEDEISIIKLISTTPDDQVLPLLNKFETDISYVLRRLHVGIDGDNLKLYYNAMRVLWQRSKSPMEWDREYTTFNAIQAKYMTAEQQKRADYLYLLATYNVFYSKKYNELGTNIVNYDVIGGEKFSRDGHTVFGYQSGFQVTQYMDRAPFELVKVISEDKNGNATEIWVPGMYMMYVANEEVNFDIESAINTTVIVAGTVTLTTAGLSPWAYLWASTDIIVSSGNLYILNEREAISARESGRKFIARWEAINLILGGAQGAHLLYEIAENARFASALAELKEAFEEYKYTDWSLLKGAKPELAAKLEAFGEKGIATLEKLKVDAALKLQQKLKDAAEINKRGVALGEDVQKVLAWLKDPGDEYFFVVIHGKGEEFSIIHNGKIELLDDNSLLKYLETHDIDAHKKVVLLSCNDIESVKKVAGQWGRDMISSNGAVRLYKNGAIESKNGLKLVSTDGTVTNYTIKGSDKVGEVEEFVELNHGASSAGGIAAFEVRMGDVAIGEYEKGSHLIVYNSSRELFGSDIIVLTSDRTTSITGVLDDVDKVIDVYSKVKPGDPANMMGAAKGEINILRSEHWEPIQESLAFMKDKSTVAEKLEKVKAVKKANAKYMQENNLTAGYTKTELEAFNVSLENGLSPAEMEELTTLFKYGDEYAYWKVVKDEFWRKANRPWLEQAVQRNDVIRFVSDPTNPANLYRNSWMVDHQKTIFGMEVDFLSNLGFKFDLKSGIAAKP